MLFRLLSRCFAPIVRRTLIEGEPLIRKQRKEMIVPVLAVLGPLGALSSLSPGQSMVSFVASVLLAVVSLAFLADILVRRSASDSWIAGIAFCYSLIVLAYDFNTQILQTARAWPLFILLLDLLLVTRVSLTYSSIVVGVVVFWQTLTALELSFRFGFYDLPGTPSQDMRKEKFDCEGRLPCQEPFGAVLLGYAARLIVFGLDFYFTRGFAITVQMEKARIQASVETADIIAQACAAFDLATARDALELGGENGLPKGLSEAFAVLIGNLESYKPYLPQSCLPHNLEEGDGWDSETIERTGTALTCERERTGSVASYSTDNCTATNTADASSTKPSEGCSRTHRLKAYVQRHHHHLPSAELKKVKVTLMVVNIKGSFSLLEEGINVFEAVHSSVLGTCLQSLNQAKGVFDSFVGDHFYASFNASRFCVSQSCSAVSAVLSMHDKIKEAGQAEINSCVFGGHAVVGDLGNSEVRRHSILGLLPLHISALERFASAASIPICCNHPVYADASTTYQIRLLTKTVIFSKKGLDVGPAVHIFEVIGSVPPPSIQDEWMYDLAGSPCKMWETHNEAVRSYLKDKKGARKTVEDLWAAAANDSSSPCFASILELLQFVQDNPVPPPAVHLSC